MIALLTLVRKNKRASFGCEVLSDPESRSAGYLGYNEKTAPKCLLFVFEKTENHELHTIDVKFPIDISFLDSNGNVLETLFNVSPGNKSVRSKFQSKYIIEMISPGQVNLLPYDKILIPMIFR